MEFDSKIANENSQKDQLDVARNEWRCNKADNKNPQPYHGHKVDKPIPPHTHHCSNQDPLATPGQTFRLDIPQIRCNLFGQVIKVGRKVFDLLARKGGDSSFREKVYDAVWRNEHFQY